MGNQLTMIHLKEVQLPLPNLFRLPSSNPPVPTSTGSIASDTTVTASPVQPKPIIQPVEVPYQDKRITDNDPGQTGSVGFCRTGFKSVATRLSDSIGHFSPESDDIRFFPFISANRIQRIPIGSIQPEPIISDLRICSNST